MSQTSKLQVVDFIFEGRRIKLIHTPGYDDTTRSDTDILKEAALSLKTLYWLISSFISGLWIRLTACKYESKITISGLLWLHPIHHVRFSGSARRNLHILQDLAGKAGYHNVRLVTTFWSSIDPREGDERIQELKRNDLFWRLMIENGSEIHKYTGGKNSAYVSSALSRIIKAVFSRFKRNW